MFYIPFILKGKPNVKAGDTAVQEVYDDVVEKHSPILRAAANSTLVDYFDAVLYDVTVQYFNENPSGERGLGQREILEKLGKMLYELKYQHQRELAQKADMV